MESNKPSARDAELRKAMDALMAEQPGHVGSPELPRHVVRERQTHRASLEGWAMMFKGLAFVCWAAGFVVIMAYVAGVTRTQRLLADAMRNVPSHLIGPSIVIAIVIIAVTALAAGAISWAISLALVSLGHIEENTRPAATTEAKHSPPFPATSPRQAPPAPGSDA